MRFFTLTTLLALAQYISATGVTLKITSPATPAAGANTITFADAGGSPSLSGLTTGVVVLMFGGWDDTTALQVAELGTIAYPTLTLTGTIAAGVGPATANGYYLKVTSTIADGGNVINYSDRFTITGMTGSAAAAYVQAVSGATVAAPAAVVNEAAAAAGTGNAAGEWGTPYQSQTGLTKYAPMQSVPPTKITKQNPTPLFPTSAYTVATTWLPKPTILTTLTQSQTFSVSSMENTAAAQSQPTGDMAKFLARWKD